MSTWSKTKSLSDDRPILKEILAHMEKLEQDSSDIGLESSGSDAIECIKDRLR